MRKRLTIILLPIALLFGLFYFIIADSKVKLKSSYVGNYKSSDPTLLEQAKFALVDIECFHSGRSIKLLVDSTFTLTDDTIIWAGKWHQDADKINLHFLTSKYFSENLSIKQEALRVPPNDNSLKCSGSDLYLYFSESKVNCAELFKTMP